MTDERMNMILDISKALDDLYKVIGKYKGERLTAVFPDPDILDNESEHIMVLIGGGKYRVNIECDSASAIVSDVVNQTVAKI